MNEERIKYLESLVPDGAQQKYQRSFKSGAGYRGNGVYSWGDVFSTDTRELFLMGILEAEHIKYKSN